MSRRHEDGPATFGLLLPGFLVLDAAAAPPLRPWLEYRTIMWVGDSPGRQPEKFPLFCQRLARDGRQHRDGLWRRRSRAAFAKSFSILRREHGQSRPLPQMEFERARLGKFVADWNKAGRSKSALVRDYCLDDPQWRAWAREEVGRIAARNGPHQPLAYNSAR
jgi:hypothetical protein